MADFSTATGSEQVSSGLNDNYEKIAHMHWKALEWTPSPHPQVLRKRLELYGPPEAGRVTSIVQYLPGSSFHAHGHPEGEEILVLEGTFQDEHGCYPEGSYLLNPEGFEHQPFSDGGCLLLVKLRQFPGTDKEHKFVNTKSTESTQLWHQLPAAQSAISELILYEQKIPVYEKICLLRVPPLLSIDVNSLLLSQNNKKEENGEEDIAQLMPVSELFVCEIFVLSDSICNVLLKSNATTKDDSLSLEQWSWLRGKWNDAQQWVIINSSAVDMLELYVKIGTRDRHLRDV